MFYTPGVYYIKEHTYDGQCYYSLEYYLDKFQHPKNIYGNIMSYVIRVWNEYAITNKTTGVLITGTKGSGKTMISTLLANLAIDNGLYVVMCVEINFTTELINFLSRLRNVVLFMDEFSRNLEYSMQAKALTMLSDIGATSKLMILTDNSDKAIHICIRDRPGRIRYHYDFEKLPQDVLLDYCSKNMDIYDSDSKFYNTLLAKYRELSVFSFDQLQAIVSEHNHYPDDDLETLLSCLNLHSLSKPCIYVVKKITDNSNNEELYWNVDNRFLHEDYFKHTTKSLGDGPLITLYKKPDKGDISAVVSLTYDDLRAVNSDGNGYYTADVYDKFGNKYSIDIAKEYA